MAKEKEEQKDAFVLDNPSLVLKRMKEALGASSDGPLADALDVSRQAISKARKTGKIPPGWFLTVSMLTRYSVDWLCFGTGEKLLNDENRPMESSHFESERSQEEDSYCTPDDASRFGVKLLREAMRVAQIWPEDRIQKRITAYFVSEIGRNLLAVVDYLEMRKTLENVEYMIGQQKKLKNVDGFLELGKEAYDKFGKEPIQAGGDKDENGA